MTRAKKIKWSDVDWAEIGISRLKESDEGKYFLALKSDDEISELWNDIGSIIRGEWNVDDLRSPEMGAAWMLLYVLHEFKTGTLPITFRMNEDKKTLSLIVNIIGENFIHFDFEEVIRDELSFYGREESLEFLGLVRKIIDELEKQIKDEEE